jgi:ketosteroid isomerase-like protein
MPADSCWTVAASALAWGICRSGTSQKLRVLYAVMLTERAAPLMTEMTMITATGVCRVTNAAAQIEAASAGHATRRTVRKPQRLKT